MKQLSSAVWLLSKSVIGLIFWGTVLFVIVMQMFKPAESYETLDEVSTVQSSQITDVDLTGTPAGDMLAEQESLNNK